MDDDVFSTIINDDSDFDQTYFQVEPEEAKKPKPSQPRANVKGIKIRVNGQTFRRKSGDARSNSRRNANRRADKRRNGHDNRRLHHSTAVHEKFWPPKEFFETMKSDLARMANNGESFYRFTREWDRMHSCGSNTFTSMAGFVDTFGEETARKIYLFMIATNGTLRSFFNHYRRDWEEVWRRDNSHDHMSNSLY